MVGLGTLALLPVYWMGSHLDAYAILLHLVIILFVFERYRLYKSMIFRNMHRRPIHDKDIHLHLNDTGITYSGDSHALEDGQANWAQIPLILETANGYIFILPRGHFMWLPFSAVSEMLPKIQAFLEEKALHIEKHPEWSC